MATKDVKLERLAAVRLFSECSKKELNLIGRASNEAVVPPGTVLCEQGRPGSEFFLILEGEAVVRRNGRKIATLGPGNHFGELALLTHLARDASVEAVTEMRLLVLSQREFAGVLAEVPSVARKMLSIMAQRLYEADSKATTH